MSSDRPGKNNSPVATRDLDRDDRADTKTPKSSAPEFAVSASARPEHDNEYARERHAPVHEAPTDPTDQDEPSSLNELLAGDSKNANKVHPVVDAFDTAQPRSARQ